MGVRSPVAAVTILSGCGMSSSVAIGRHSTSIRGPIYGLAFTPDSRSLLSGSEDGTLRVWDMAKWTVYTRHPGLRRLPLRRRLES